MDQLAARGHEQVHLGLWMKVHAAKQKDLAHPLAKLGPARFTDEDRAAWHQSLTQQLDLRRLARALGALESDEEPSAHG